MGMGFTFDDTDNGTHRRSADARSIRKNQRTPSEYSRTSGERKLTTARRMPHHRYVINFGEMTEEEAQDGPI